MRLALPLAALAVVLLAAYATAPPVALADAPPEALADSTEWENLEVLPDTLTRPQLIGIMRGFAASLGVGCDHCHSGRHGSDELYFASDANVNKGVARDMMRMTATLDQETLAVMVAPSLTERVLVTCYTCHRGATTPATELPLREDR